MTKQSEDAPSKIAIFRGKRIRKAIYQGEWHFSLIDVVEVLTESTYANRYWSDLKIQLSMKEGFDQLYEKIVRLKLEAPDKKMRGQGTNRKASSLKKWNLGFHFFHVMIDGIDVVQFL